MRKPIAVIVVIVVVALAGAIDLSIVLPRRQIEPVPPTLLHQTALGAAVAPDDEPPGLPAILESRPSLAEKLLPWNSLVAVVVRDVPKIVRQSEGTDLAVYLQDPQDREFILGSVTRLVDMIVEEAGEDDFPEFFRDPLKLAGEFVRNLSGDLGIAFRIQEAGEEHAVAMFFVAQLHQPQEMERFIEQAWQAAQATGEWEHVVADGLTIHTYAQSPATFSYAVDGNLFLATFCSGRDGRAPALSPMQEILTRHKEAIVPVDCLWRNERYQSITTRLPLEAGALFYVDLPSLFLFLNESMEREGAEGATVRALNLRGFGPAGLRLTIDSKNERSDARLLLRDSTSGIPALIASLLTESPQSLVQTLPADALFVAVAALNPPESWRAIKQFIIEMSPDALSDLQDSLQEFQQETGVDLETELITPLGRSMAFFIPTDGGAFPPIGMLRNLSSPLLVVEAQNPVRLAQAIDKLANLLAQHANLPIARSQYRGVEVTTLQVPIEGPMEPIVTTITRLEPSYAVVDHFLVIGLSAVPVRVFIRGLLDVEPRLPTNEAFTATLERVSPNLGAVSFLDTAAAMKTYSGVIMPTLNVAAKMMPQGFRPSIPTLPSGERLAGILDPGITVLRVRPDEVLFEEIRSPALQTLYLAIQMRFWVDMIRQQRVTEQRRTQVLCMRNLQELAFAAINYRTNRGEWPASLEAVAREEDLPRHLLFCLSDEMLADNDTSSYVSAFDLADRPLQRVFPMPEDFAALPMIWGSEARHDGLRNVVFFDGHVESITEQVFARFSNAYNRPWPSTDPRGEQPVLPRGSIACFTVRSEARAYIRPFAEQPHPLCVSPVRMRC